jgi:hypothetical protein
MAPLAHGFSENGAGRRGRPPVWDVEGALTEVWVWYRWHQRLPSSSEWKRSWALRQGGAAADRYLRRVRPGMSAIHRLFGSWEVYILTAYDLIRLIEMYRLVRPEEVFDAYSSWWSQLPVEGRRARTRWSMANFVSHWMQTHPLSPGAASLLGGEPVERRWWEDDWMEPSDHPERFRDRA